MARIHRTRRPQQWEIYLQPPACTVSFPPQLRKYIYACLHIYDVICQYLLGSLLDISQYYQVLSQPFSFPYTWGLPPRAQNRNIPPKKKKFLVDLKGEN